MRARLLYILFFLSGAAGLIYQILWVRAFGNVFGNTIHSASLVIAVFMLGLGAGSYAAGRWADRRYASRPGLLLGAYGAAEIAIGAAGLLISLVLPRLDRLSAMVSWYARADHGWWSLSPESYAARYAIAVVLLTPATFVMGATLTLLVRHVVAERVDAAGRRIAALYGVNAAGAAVGCFLTDAALVPALGLARTQAFAVALNVMAGLGALALARGAGRAAGEREERRSEQLAEPSAVAPATKERDHGPRGKEPAAAMDRSQDPRPARGAKGETAGIRDAAGSDSDADRSARAVLWTSAAVFLSGFAGLGMEIVWFRHAGTLLGDYRSVFSLLLTIVLSGICLGALAGGALLRWTGRPGLLAILAQAGFIAFSLWGLAQADVSRHIARLVAAQDRFLAASSGARALLELWLNARPLLLEMGIPALLLGASYPLANAIVQRAASVVGRRAGLLYLANTVGAVTGSVLVGFVLLPGLGLQASATALALVSSLSMGAYALSPVAPGPERRATHLGFAGGAMLAALSVCLWLTLPSDALVRRATQLRPGERTVAFKEGVNVTVAVTELSGGARSLWTNGYSIAANSRMGQRYMRAFSHVPLLTMEAPESVLVICFGVGNTVHAASLHPSVRRIELVDLSKEVLEQAPLFAATNKDVLRDPRISVFVNDGRHHLLMSGYGPYDLITLEPPPIAFAGVSSLYSREFYELARARLTPRGFMAQWIPAYQVDESATLAMVRAFLDVFPRTVLLSGTYHDFVLIGTAAPSLALDPGSVESRLAAAPALREDLENIHLGTPVEFFGMFAASDATMRRAAARAEPLTDDRPLLEYASRSRLWDHSLPAALFDVSDVGAWCPSCASSGAFVRPLLAEGRRNTPADDLRIYLGIMGGIYKSPAFLRHTWPPLPGLNRFPVSDDADTRRVIQRSGYLSTHFR